MFHYYNNGSGNPHVCFYVWISVHDRFFNIWLLGWRVHVSPVGIASIMTKMSFQKGGVICLLLYPHFLPSSSFPNIHRSLKILSCSFGKPHLSPQEEIYPPDPFHYCVNLSESKEGHLKRASSAWSWQALNNAMGSLRFWGSVLVHTSHWNSPQISHG